MRTPIIAALLIALALAGLFGCAGETKIAPASIRLEHTASATQPSTVKVTITGAAATSQPASTQPATADIDGVKLSVPAGGSATVEVSRGGDEHEEQRGEAVGAAFEDTTGSGTDAATKVNTAPPELQITPSGSSGKGGGFAFDSVVTAGAASSPLTYLGGALIIIGIAVLVARFVPALQPFAAVVPWTVGALLIAGGSAIAFLPYIYAAGGPIAAYSIVGLFLLAGVGALLWFAHEAGWFKAETGPEKQLKLKTEGHHEGAGTLAWLATKGDALTRKTVAKRVSAPQAAPTPTNPETPKPQT